MEPVYLDHAAATPMRPEARAAVLSVQAEGPGNPSSVHRRGQKARRTLDEARARSGRALGVDPRSVHFMRGGTESDNLAVLGRAERVLAEGRSPLLVRTPVEHSAVREAVREAVRRGAEELVLPISPEGAVEEVRLREILSRGPSLVSILWVNHETGSCLPVPRVVTACRAAEVPVHVDAVQAPGRIALEPEGMEADLFTVSGHKVGGPPGTAILLVRDRSLLLPRVFGGGQEEGLRPGTEDVAGALGLAVALELATAEWPREAERIERLRDRLQAGLVERIPGLVVHGGEGPRAPHILNVGVPGLPRDLLPRILDMEGIASSAGSACRSGGTDVSPVLAGYYGEGTVRGRAPLRLSLGWSTEDREIEVAIERIPAAIARAKDAGLGAPQDSDGRGR